MHISQYRTTRYSFWYGRHITSRPHWGGNWGGDTSYLFTFRILHKLAFDGKKERM